MVIAWVVPSCFGLDQAEQAALSEATSLRLAVDQYLARCEANASPSCLEGRDGLKQQLAQLLLRNKGAENDPQVKAVMGKMTAQLGRLEKIGKEVAGDGAGSQIDPGGQPPGAAPRDPNKPPLGDAGAGLGPGSAGSSETPGADAALIEKLRSDPNRLDGAQKGLDSAARLAGTMKNSLRHEEELPGGAGAAARMGSFGGPGNKPGAGGSGDPSHPLSMNDFLLAAGPYRDAFKTLNLRTGTGPNGAGLVLRQDGSPATPADLANLRTLIDSEPTALTRNSNYLDPDKGGVSRAGFNELKTDYRSNADMRDTDFKHIELEKDRDFKRSQSCDLVSGQCNAHAKASYKKGEDVPADDLKSILAKAKSYLRKVAEDKQQLAASKSRLKGGFGEGVLSRLSAMLGGFAPSIGGSAPPQTLAASAGPSVAGGESVANAPKRISSDRPGETRDHSGAGLVRSREESGEGDARPQRRGGMFRLAAYLMAILGAALAVAAAALLFRKRRSLVER
ncbi:MAG: hypothetical protein HY077_00455 [Elusimicrobia bacterium]|nr:hypothetical protein [Elusimicrobiota bacterium]